MPIAEKKIVGKECRFAVYVPPPEWGAPDKHVVKEIVTYDDGSSEAKLHEIDNFIRSAWVTLPGMRNHQQKKEWEDLDRLREIQCTQTLLIDTLAKAIGTPFFKGNLRKLCDSPYIYGADILSTAILKKGYQDKYADTPATKFSVAALDIETDTVNAETFGQAVMCTVSFKQHVVTVIRKYVLEGWANVQERVDAAMEKHLGSYVKKRKLQCQLIVVDSEIDLWRESFAVAHRLKPDFVAIWNMEFEMDRFLEACDRARVDPKTIVSDPGIHPDYQYFNFKRGQSQKVTVSGKVTPIKPAARWHTVFCPASFYIIDSMCTYKQTRVGQQEESSYKLDSILEKELKITKLKHEEAEQYKGIKWFQAMQSTFLMDYIVYNRFDCIGLEELDEKIMDLSVTLPRMAATSDFCNFNSQPRRLVDELHWEVQEKKKIIGTSGSTLIDEHGDSTLDLEDWIITLPAPLVVDNGLRCIAENPELRTAIRVHVGDLDVSASYPNGGCVYNISKETTSRELVDIEGIPEEVFRQQNMGLTAGQTNAVEYCTHMFHFPELTELLDAFEAEERKLELNL